LQAIFGTLVMPLPTAVSSLLTTPLAKSGSFPSTVRP
jgi:hypothetical protein